ncbi:MAG: hypothetical protein RLZ67_400 [Actinomycetota bacterium]
MGRKGARFHQPRGANRVICRRAILHNPGLTRTAPITAGLMIDEVPDGAMVNRAETARAASAFSAQGLARRRVR